MFNVFNKSLSGTLLDYEHCHKHVISNKYVSMRHNLRQLSFKTTEMKDHKSIEAQTKSIYNLILLKNNFKALEFVGNS